jgi:hypothetical protein
MIKVTGINSWGLVSIVVPIFNINTTDADVLLPDMLNTFFTRFEENIVPPTWPTAWLT